MAMHLKLTNRITSINNWAGIKEDQGRYLNINRGFGFIGFSGRVGIWPEITVITLKRKV